MVMNRVSKSSGGFDLGLVFSNLALVITLALALIGWLVAFIGTAAAEANAGHQGVLWFAVFLELILILGIILTLGTDSIGMARLQLSCFLAVALVFTVIGIDKGIYNSDITPSSQKAAAAGFFILTILNVIWLLFFTSDEGSPLYNFFHSFGNGQLSGGGRFGSSGGNHLGGAGLFSGAIGGGGGVGGGSGGGIGAPSMRNGTSYANGGVGGFGSNSVGGSYQPAYGSSPSAADLNNTTGSVAKAPSMRSTNAAGTNPAASRSQTGHGNGSVVGGAPSEVHSPISRSGAAPLDGQSNNGDTVPDYGYRARALYAYQANADDPTEISFSKGEVLDIVDNSGKWWQARKADGTSGIVPSNYLALL